MNATDVKIIFFIQCSIMVCLLSCASLAQKNNYKPASTDTGKTTAGIIPAADQINSYIDYLKGKNVGMNINQTSVIGKRHALSLDSLLKLGVAIKNIYGPEHGFRGEASNGADVSNSIDSKTGIPVISIYGNKHF